MATQVVDAQTTEQQAAPPNPAEQQYKDWRSGITVTRNHPTERGIQQEVGLDGDVRRSWRVSTFGRPQKIAGTERDGAEPGPLPDAPAEELPPQVPAPVEASSEPAPVEGDQASEDAASVEAATDPSPAPAVEQATEKVAAPVQDEVDPELARVRQASVPTPPPAATQAPAPAAGEIDYSDMPDFSNAEKYPTDEGAEQARREYFQRKANEHAAAQLKGVSDRQAQERYQVAMAEAQRRGDAMLAQTKTLSGLDDAEFESRKAEVGQIVHPQRRDVNGPPNPVQHVLINARDQHLASRAQAGLGVDRHEGIPEFMAEQFKDPEYARALAGGFPDTTESGLLLTAVAEVAPSVTPVLRHLVETDEGKDFVRRMTRQVIDPQRPDPSTVGVLMNHARSEVAQLVARLSAAPGNPPVTVPASAPSKPAAEPTRAQAVSVPRGSSSPSPEAGKQTRVDPRSQEWQNEIMRREMAKARSRGRGWNPVV